MPHFSHWAGKVSQNIKCQTLSEEPLDHFLLRQQFLKKSFPFYALLGVVSLCWSTTATFDTLLIPSWGNHILDRFQMWTDPGGYSQAKQKLMATLWCWNVVKRVPLLLSVFWVAVGRIQGRGPCCARMLWSLLWFHAAWDDRRQQITSQQGTAKLLWLLSICIML